MDFFTAANDSASIGQVDTNPFAQAIHAGFGNFTARLPASLPSPSPGKAKATKQTTTTTTTTPKAASFPPVIIDDLAELISISTVLFIDIRPHAAFANARLPNALSLSVPSTLLKRPLFSLERLAAMLSSSTSRSRFLQWDQSTQIVVYDADSSSLPETSNIFGLLKKFANENPTYAGKLGWLKGGFQGVWRDRKELIDASALSQESGTSSSTLQTSLLPPSAFRAPKRSSPAAGALRPSMSLSHPHQAYNPFFDTVRQNIELSHGITERIPLKLPQRVKERISDLPFQWLRDIASRCSSSEESDVEDSMEALAMQFYRIELAEQRRLMGVMEHHSRESQCSDRSEVPRAKPFPFSITAGVEKGGKNRYRHIWPFEHARVRLHNTGSRATKSQAAALHDTTSKSIPPPSIDDDDYVNASYVQPLCTKRRYIATQGPLDATFVDFWTLVWQQNVHVILMLTREVEGASIKCGYYWKEGYYGPLHLKLVSVEGQEDLGETVVQPSGTGFFNFKTNEAPPPAPNPIIKRTFILSHTHYPQSTPRRITHFQYLDWPDMNVPDDPKGVLNLLKEVNTGMEESQARQSPPTSPSSGPLELQDIQVDPVSGVAKHEVQGIQPLLLHCSAGVGRTGGFIAVDSVLDGIRNEIRMKAKATRSNSALDVDGDVVMDNEGRQTMSMPPNHEGDVLHVPIVGSTDQPIPALTKSQQWAEHMSSSLQDSGFISTKSSTPSSHSTMRWAQQVSEEPAPMTGIASSLPESRTLNQLRHREPSRDSDSRSSLDSSGNSSSEESSLFGFPRSRKRNEIKDTDDEVSPLGGYATSSSLTTNSTVESGCDNKRHFNFTLTADNVGGVKGLLTRRWADDIPRTRTLSAPEPSLEAVATPPPPSRSLSPSLNLPEESNESSHRGSSPPPSVVGTEVSTALPPLVVPVAVPELDKPTTPSPPPTTSFTNVDYKEPRSIHSRASPPPLSSYETPLCEVVQDMREQRMSLCQSLRQYVFVHAVVIEGALMIADEERNSSSGQSTVDAPPVLARAPTSQLSGGSGLASLLAPMLTFSENGSSSSGKRRASPTELPHESIKGEERLSKRPSVKRKQRSSEGDLPMAQHYRKNSISRERSGDSASRMRRPSFEIG